jgi:hypothetical protein
MNKIKYRTRLTDWLSDKVIRPLHYARTWCTEIFHLILCTTNTESSVYDVQEYKVSPAITMSVVTVILSVVAEGGVAARCGSREATAAGHWGAATRFHEWGRPLSSEARQPPARIRKVRSTSDFLTVVLLKPTSNITFLLWQKSGQQVVLLYGILQSLWSSYFVYVITIWA